MDLRSLARSGLPGKAFLRRDRGAAMYVTNAPALGWRGGAAGFRTETQGALARLYITPELMQECDFEPDKLARELSRFTGGSEQAAALFARCMKLAEAPAAAEYEKCSRLVRQAAAVALRAGGGEGLYFCALALAEAGRRLDGIMKGD